MKTKLNKIERVVDKLNPYPGYLEKGHLTDGSEECWWEERNEKIKSALHQEIQNLIKEIAEEMRMEKKFTDYLNEPPIWNEHRAGFNQAVQEQNQKLSNLLEGFGVDKTEITHGLEPK